MARAVCIQSPTDHALHTPLNADEGFYIVAGAGTYTLLCLSAAPCEVVVLGTVEKLEVGLRGCCACFGGGWVVAGAGGLPPAYLVLP